MRQARPTLQAAPAASLPKRPTVSCIDLNTTEVLICALQLLTHGASKQQNVVLVEQFSRSRSRSSRSSSWCGVDGGGQRRSEETEEVRGGGAGQ
ncbi:hypothetical protein PR202_ga20805 [Eleusine coracana subsp. coracana]|uniref:Uncharacterized protein n=1 Tax=Eleusine coracana subsp. coracana TaxID=191504 RepID=A0AAV5CZQ7_ELECO|nr:hypothetical protein PR202_ga20805 [Eleusine coracana subsp. coracana]